MNYTHPSRRARRRTTFSTLITIGLALTASACGSDDDSSGDSDTATTPDTEASADTTGADTTGANTTGANTTGANTTTADSAEETEATSFSVYISEPDSIDPALNGEMEGAQVVRQLFLSLVDLSPSMEPQPGAAASWSVADDGVTWTFELVDGATFTDGTPVDAHDVVYSFARSADPDLASPVAYQGLPIIGWAEVMGGEPSGAIGDVPVSGITAVDDTTIEIVTDGPFGLLPLLLTYPSFAPVPSELAGDPDAEAAFADMPIGNGRYEMVEPWQHNESITLAKNPDFPGTPGKADRIEFRIYSDSATAFRDAQAGTLDLARGLPPDVLEEARAEFGDRYVETATATISYVGFPTAVAPYDNVDLRRAMSMVIDREALATGVLQGVMLPATGVVPPGVPGALSDACQYCTYDPDGARALLEAAGGPPAEPVVLYDISDDGTALVDYLVSTWQRELGIEVEVRSFEWAQFLDETTSGVAVGPFELGWVWDYPSPYSIVSPLYESTSDVNNLDWVDDEFDSLMAVVRESADEATAIPSLERSQEIVLDQLPLIPLGFTNSTGVFSERITGAVSDTGAVWRLELIEVVG